MSRIVLTIDRVVLRGFEAGERNALVAGLESELSQLLADPTTRAAWARSRRTPVLRLGQLPLAPGPSGARKFGQTVAAAVAKNLAPPAR